jgi:hypothetical protein
MSFFFSKIENRKVKQVLSVGLLSMGRGRKERA